MKKFVRRIRLALCLGALFTLFSGTTVFGAERPNIVIIVADDLGWGHVGWQNPTVQTPHLDRLAEGGVKLNHHYVAPVCSPTRVALMTGRYWSRFGVLGALPSEPTSLARAMPSGTATIASALKASGYRTALVGKWHLGAQPDAGPEAFGFDHFYGIRVGGCTPLTHKWLGTGPSVLWEGNEIIEPSGHITDLFGEAATDWIARDSDDPFFLFLSFTAPHVPLQESERWMDMYEESAPDQAHQLYWAAISHLDEAVGRVMAEIDRLGEKDNTLVVFFGDNGSPGQRNLMQVRIDHDAYLDVTLPGTNLPLRGKKGDVYDGGIRTPTFASWPAVLKPGVCNAPLHVTDWMPTLCALVGHQPAKDLKWDGRNIMPRLQAPALPATDRALYTRSSGNSFALRHGEWKLVFTGGQAKAELYNIVEDCGETTDLAAAHPEFVQRLGDLQNEASKNDNDCLASRQPQQPRTQLAPQAIAARIQQMWVWELTTN